MSVAAQSARYTKTTDSLLARRRTLYTIPQSGSKKFSPPRSQLKKDLAKSYSSSTSLSLRKSKTTNFNPPKLQTQMNAERKLQRTEADFLRQKLEAENRNAVKAYEDIKRQRILEEKKIQKIEESERLKKLREDEEIRIKKL